MTDNLNIDDLRRRAKGVGFGWSEDAFTFTMWCDGGSEPTWEEERPKITFDKVDVSGSIDFQAAEDIIAAEERRQDAAQGKTVCEALYSPTHWNSTANRCLARCTAPGKFRIDGKLYCGTHRNRIERKRKKSCPKCKGEPWVMSDEGEEICCPICKGKEATGGKVTIKPHIGFGRPCIDGTGIPAEIVWERHTAGETVDELMHDYNRSREDIEAAIKYWDETPKVFPEEETNEPE